MKRHLLDFHLIVIDVVRFLMNAGGDTGIGAAGIKQNASAG
jgi:hypothetical protein